MKHSTIGIAQRSLNTLMHRYINIMIYHYTNTLMRKYINTLVYYIQNIDTHSYLFRSVSRKIKLHKKVKFFFFKSASNNILDLYPNGVLKTYFISFASVSQGIKTKEIFLNPHIRDNQHVCNLMEHERFFHINSLDYNLSFF